MSTLRSKVIRLASLSDELRPHLLKVLKTAEVFPTEKALQTYLKDHPNADRSNHSVDTKSEKPSLKKIPENATIKDLPKSLRQEIPDYKMDIVGDSAKQALSIAQKIKAGIDKAADICHLNPPVCQGNKGLSRDKMPQIEGEKSVRVMLSAMPDDKEFKELSDKVNKAREEGEGKLDLNKAIPDKSKRDAWLDRAKGEAMVHAGADPKSEKSILHQMLSDLEKSGVKTEQTEMPVGKMKATQKEIQAGKVFAMADAHMKGKFDGIDDSVVVSKDDHILDGHHRWAALLTIDPSRKMKVKKIDMTMDDLLKAAAAQPGVYKADFSGVPLPEKDQKEYKKDNPPKSSKKSSFRSQVIRLAYEYPQFRSTLLASLESKQ